MRNTPTPARSTSSSTCWTGRATSHCSSLRSAVRSSSRGGHSSASARTGLRSRSTRWGWRRWTACSPRSCPAFPTNAADGRRAGRRHTAVRRRDGAVADRPGNRRRRRRPVSAGRRHRHAPCATHAARAPRRAHRRARPAWPRARERRLGVGHHLQPRCPDARCRPCRPIRSNRGCATSCGAGWSRSARTPSPPNRASTASPTACSGRLRYETLTLRDRKKRHLVVAAYLADDFPGGRDEVAELIAQHLVDAIECVPARRRCRGVAGRGRRRAATGRPTRRANRRDDQCGRQLRPRSRTALPRSATPRARSRRHGCSPRRPGRCRCTGDTTRRSAMRRARDTAVREARGGRAACHGAAHRGEGALLRGSRRRGTARDPAGRRARRVRPRAGARRRPLHARRPSPVREPPGGGRPHEQRGARARPAAQCRARPHE